MIQVDALYLIMVVIIVGVIVAFVIVLHRMYTKKLVQNLKENHDLEIKHQKELLQQNIVTQEKERARIAKKVHDDIGNKLHVISIWLKSPNFWENARSKDITEKQVPELIETVRNVSHELYPVSLEKFGLIFSIEEVLSQLSFSLHTDLIIDNYDDKLNKQQDLQIFRVFQEFTSNTIKYAKAKGIFIHFRTFKTCQAIIISDDGIGCNMKGKFSGMGINNMENRLLIIGAKYKWKSMSNKGMRLIITLRKDEY